MKELLVAGVLALGLTVSGAPTVAAVAPAAGDAPASDRKAARVNLTVEASKENVVLGSRVRFRGKARPRAAGERVLLQQRGLRRGASWKTQDATRIGRRGTFRLQDRPTALVPRRYRVLKPATGKSRRAVSTTMRVRVYRWRSINELDARRTTMMYAVDRVRINAVAYSDARVAASSTRVSSVDWNIDRGCLRLRGRFGLSDESDTGASALLELEADGSTRYRRSFALGRSATATLDLRGVFRLALRSTPANVDSPGAVGGMGTLAAAEVLCSF